MQVILDSSFARPGSAPKWGKERKESSGTGSVFDKLHCAVRIAFSAEYVVFS